MQQLYQSISPEKHNEFPVCIWSIGHDGCYAGATLLIDSDPIAEEQETRLKASALLAAIRGEVATRRTDIEFADDAAASLRVLMVDHQDSFVHNLAGYFRQFGVQLITLQPVPARKWLLTNSADLVILSPGPSTPQHFAMKDTIDLVLEKKIPIFGACLGLQGIVEYFGGSLKQLAYPMHGKASVVSHTGSVVFADIEQEFTAGRYHSLVAAKVPDVLQVTATTADGNVMAVEHKSLPVSAVQFHPESIMSLQDQVGKRLIRNVVMSVLEFKRGREAS